MKRSLDMATEHNTNSSLTTVEGYVVHVGIISKNSNNNNHHYSVLFSTTDQSVLRITKFLGKIATCAFHTRLRESMCSGRGALITGLRQQNDQYYCTNSTKLTDKDLDFRPMCVRKQFIEDLRKNTVDGYCTIEVKVCDIGPETPYIFEQSDFKKIQKSKKVIIVADYTGALELSIWEPNFNQIKLNECYQIKLLKYRIINSCLSLTAVGDTTFIKIDDLGTVKTDVESSVITTQTSKGRIKKVSKDKEYYGCQACGSHDLTKQSDYFLCNVCESRVATCNTSTDDSLKITIVTDNHEEYCLWISECLIISLLNSINNSNVNDLQNSNITGCFDFLTNLMVEFQFDQQNGRISELKSIENSNLPN